MSAVTKTLAFFFPEQGRQGFIPHATSGRMWLLRLGYYKLNASLEPANDWAFLADHAIEIGKHRFLGIIGIRLSNLPPPGKCLQLSDMTPIALLPVESSTQEIVHQQLEALVVKTGVLPRAILSDEGSDLSGGIDRFCKAHPETTRYRDLPHLAARLLKKRLEKNARWQAFIQAATQTKFATAQTELAILIPPRLRSKARYMNLAGMLSWAEKVLTVLDDPSLVAPELASAERLNEKFGWMRDYRADVQQWSGWLTIIDATLDIVRRDGYCASTSGKVTQVLDALPKTAESELLKQELIAIVDTESSKAKPGERLPSSTEILESSFGKLKEIEGNQTHSGFTSLILIWAALFGVTTPPLIRDAMTHVSVKHVKEWIQTNLGPTVQSKRAKLAHALRKKATENPEEP